MIAFKGFNKDMTCTMGNGVFQYEIGKTYQENECKCGINGFHCVEEPLEVLSWYNKADDRYCVVEVDGDIHESGDKRIASKKMRIIKEISKQELGMLECMWIQKHPQRETGRHVERDCGYASDGIVVVRGKNPKAKGEAGTTIFLLKEKSGSSEIKEVGVYQIDNKEYLENQYYRTDGRRVP